MRIKDQCNASKYPPLAHPVGVVIPEYKEATKSGDREEEEVRKSS